MPAINFHKRFADLVATGKKTNTIRRTIRAKGGDLLHLYTGQRTKYCRKIGEGRLIQVIPVIVGKHELWLGQDRVLSEEAQNLFAEAVGFKSYMEATEFYENYNSLPFHGYLHTWKLTKTFEAK